MQLVVVLHVSQEEKKREKKKRKLGDSSSPPLYLRCIRELVAALFGPDAMLT